MSVQPPVAPHRVAMADIDIPFWRMVAIMIKWSLAAIPAFIVISIIFGIIGYNQASKADVQAGGKGMAIAGIICGIIGCLIGAMTFLR